VTRPSLASVVGALLVTAVVGLGAHHSVPVNFDQSREVTVTGVITEIKWVNPHSHWRLDVKTDEGATVEWLVEFGAVNTMKRAGFPMERFKFGDTVSVTGYPGRRDRAVLLRTVLHDGVRLNPEMKPEGVGGAAN
jgi:hypothetical protein